MKRTSVSTLVALVLAACPAGLAPASSIADATRHAWQENLGWSDWGGAGGVTVSGTVLSGYVWLENAGWLSLGDGAPVDGLHYGNASADDFGVNILPDGSLEGYGWGENIGWVRFDGTGPDGMGARLVYCDRLLGFAWGENVGWINLDDASAFVGLDPSAPAPPGIPVLTASLLVTRTLLDWTLLPEATAYDVIAGDLTLLHSTAGNFSVATQDCLADDVYGTSEAIDTFIPVPGGGFWYLVRPLSCGGAGTWDSGSAGQAASRDPGINASPSTCP
jgi:hypothetical protein